MVLLLNLEEILQKLKLKNDIILVGSAVLDNYFSKYCYQNSIQGYEFLFTIPGTVGGNIYMNAGCYGKRNQRLFN